MILITLVLSSLALADPWPGCAESCPDSPRGGAPCCPVVAPAGPGDSCLDGYAFHAGRCRAIAWTSPSGLALRWVPGDAEAGLEPLYFSRSEVARTVYVEVMGSDPTATRSIPSDGGKLVECTSFGTGGDLPVTCLSWIEAVAFANALSIREGLAVAYEISPAVTDDDGRQRPAMAHLQPAAGGYRLPTPDEWAHAARAGHDHRYAGTDEPTELCTFANIRDRSALAASRRSVKAPRCDDGHADLAPVCSFQPNDFDLCDMSGSLWEPVWGPDAQRHQSRGGSFLHTEDLAQWDYVNRVDPENINFGTGIRLVRPIR